MLIPTLHPLTGWLSKWGPDDVAGCPTLIGINVSRVLVNCHGEPAADINGGPVTVRGVHAHVIRCLWSETTDTDCRRCKVIDSIDSSQWLAVR